MGVDLDRDVVPPELRYWAEMAELLSRVVLNATRSATGQGTAISCSPKIRPTTKVR